MKLQSFLKNTSGNTAIMFSLAAIPILVSIGAAIDMVRMNDANTLMQAATDATALAAMSGKKNSLDEHKIEKLALQYLKLNDADKTIKNVEVKNYGFDKSKQIYHVKMTGKIDTLLMGIVGYKTMDVGAYSEVDGGNTPTLELSLVLDVTNSMNAEGRLDADERQADRCRY
jgi:Flp pilus assembly protein TadG